MRATASLCNQGKPEFFKSLVVIFLEMSTLRMLHECTSFAPVFGCPRPLSSFSSLERVCLSILRSPRSLASLMSNAVVAFAHLHWSILATRLSYFHLRFWTTAAMSFELVLCFTSTFVTLPRHTICSIICSTFRWQVWSILFSFFVSNHVWAQYIRARNMQHSRTAFLSPVFGICWSV